MSWRLGSGWYVAEPASTPSTPVWHSTSWSRPWLVATTDRPVQLRSFRAVLCVAVRAYRRLRARNCSGKLLILGIPVDTRSTSAPGARDCASGQSSGTRKRPTVTRAISGRNTQRSTLATSTWFPAVSLRVSPSHLSGLDGRTDPSSRVTSAAAQEALSRLGKGLDLRKLVAGVGFEPTTSGL
jgi:hypothetical protein